jgi:hypothetical protein
MQFLLGEICDAANGLTGVPADVIPDPHDPGST